MTKGQASGAEGMLEGGGELQRGSVDAVGWGRVRRAGQAISVTFGA